MAANIMDGIMPALKSFGTMGLITIIIAILIIISLAIGGWAFFFRKRWQLKCEFKMTRSNGQVTMAEWGKARLDLPNGCIWIKRKSKRAESIKAKDLAKYLQGSDTITVIGNTGNWKLVIPDSYMEVTDEESGESAAVIKLITDTKSDKAWADNFERTAKQTFTIQSFLQQYGQFLGWGFIILVLIIGQFVGFSMVLDKIK
jgi:hypothetical protein